MFDSGISAPGNKSYTSALKRGRSSFKNFGKFASHIARISTTSSLRSGYALFKEPAITSTDLTALIPKS